MTTMTYELMTISALVFFTVAMCLLHVKTCESLDKPVLALWKVKATRTGTAESNIRSILMTRRTPLEEEILLGEGRCRMGNRGGDDVYIDASGKRVCLYLNVYKGKIYMSVLRGSVKIAAFEYNASSKKRIEISHGMKVVMADVTLEFMRREMV